jgi:hypothetical protein
MGNYALNKRMDQSSKNLEQGIRHYIVPLDKLARTSNPTQDTVQAMLDTIANAHHFINAKEAQGAFKPLIHAYRADMDQFMHIAKEMQRQVMVREKGTKAVMFMKRRRSKSRKRSAVASPRRSHQCARRTNGAQCRRKVGGKSKFCWQHKRK